MKLHFCLALFFSSFACSKISSCSSLNFSYRKNHSTILIMQLKFFMQPPPSLFFPQIKSEKSFCLVNTGLGLLPCFHYSGLMPDHLILSSSLCKQWSLISNDSDICLLFFLLFFWSQAFLNAHWSTEEKWVCALMNSDFQTEKVGTGGLKGLL